MFFLLMVWAVATTFAPCGAQFLYSHCKYYSLGAARWFCPVKARYSCMVTAKDIFNDMKLQELELEESEDNDGGK